METTFQSSMPNVGSLQALRGFQRHGFLQYIGELWKQNGDVFRLDVLNRHMVVALHPDAVRHVNVTNRQNYEKRQSYDIVRKYLVGNGLLTSNGEFWRRQRKVMAPFYTPKAVQAYAEIMLRDGKRLQDRWKSRTSTAV